jgi:3-dehydroquinate synthase class II
MGIERKVTGLENPVTQVEEAKIVLKSLERQIGEISINPADPNDVERTIREAGRLIDEKMMRYAGNAIVRILVQDFREKVRERFVISGTGMKST